MAQLQTEEAPNILGTIWDEIGRRAKEEKPPLITIAAAEAKALRDEIVGGWEINDWENPDYDECEQYRAEVLDYIRKHPEVLPGLKAHYKNSPADFITDWGYTT